MRLLDVTAVCSGYWIVRLRGRRQLGTSAVTDKVKREFLGYFGCYLFFQPPRCPGAPPVERGAGPNSGPDWRESVGWKILLPVLAPVLSGGRLRDGVRSGR